jgi:phosphatidate cytidylyltransferase
MTSGRFADLRARCLSALVMAAVGAAAVWAGGYVFWALAAALAGVMVWELHRMLVPAAPDHRAQSEGVAAAIVVGVFSLSWGGLPALIAMFISATILAWRLDRTAPVPRWVYGAYLALILSAAHGLIALREGFGPLFVLWLVLVVIASDVAGYFVGRLVGGPKFWARVSPKKTWSGTVAGWLAAAAVGAWFDPGLALLSVLLAFAGQMGDIAESALKRRAGVKDSSSLIPGHGGFLDRFDAMIAVAALAWVIVLLGVLR